MHVEMCEKHLLYEGDCRVAGMAVAAAPGQWQTIQLQLPGAGLNRGDLLAPRFLVFSVAVGTSGRSVELDNLQATDASARELLANGDFSAGMARWFSSSDRNHLPWHMKNMELHVLFEQGWVGLALFSLLLVSAGWRLAIGNARDHSLAPPLAGALAGFIVVGLFDSLLDAPRVAFIFYFLLLASLMLASFPARRLPTTS